MKSPLDPQTIELPDPRVVAIVRGKTTAERLATVFACNRMIRLRLAGHLRLRYPAWTDDQVAAEIARRMSGGAA